MIIQLPGPELISLLAQLTDERHHQMAPKVLNPPQPRLCQCRCGHHSAKMADFQDRFVPPRLDL